MVAGIRSGILSDATDPFASKPAPTGICVAWRVSVGQSVAAVEGRQQQGYQSHARYTPEHSSHDVSPAKPSPPVDSHPVLRRPRVAGGLRRSITIEVETPAAHPGDSAR